MLGACQSSPPPDSPPGVRSRPPRRRTLRSSFPSTTRPPGSSQHPPPPPLPHRRLPVRLADRDRRQRAAWTRRPDRPPARGTPEGPPPAARPQGRGRALRAAWGSPAGRLLHGRDLSTDLRGLLPLVAPLLSGHSDLAIGTRLARSRVVRGPKRESSRAPTTGCCTGSLGARSLTLSAASRPSAATCSTALPTLRTTAGSSTPSCWCSRSARAADPRGAGRLGRRSGLARGHRPHRGRATCAASRGCSPRRG